MELTETGVTGRVKGNYKDAYEINLNFQNDPVSAQCDCPLEEEWCKHAVSVALTSIQNHLFERFWSQPYTEIEPCLALSDTHHYEGHYRFAIDWDLKPRNLSLKLWDRHQEEQVLKLEPILKAALAMQQAGTLELSTSAKRELKIIQFLYKQSEADPQTGWFHVPQKDLEPLMDLLSEVEELCYAKNDGRIYFETEPLNPLLSVNASMVGNVLIALHWIKKSSPEDVFPLEEIHLFGREIKWGFYNNRIYPLTTTLRNLPNTLTRSTFYDIRDADGGKFVFEELPQIRKHVEVEQSQMIDKATLEQEPPKRVLILRRLDATTLRAELVFAYDEARIPYSKGNEAPYVTVTDAEADTIYWLKRDRKGEEKAFQTLLKLHLQPVQTNHFSAEGDDAIDFYNLDRAQLERDGWVFETEDDFSDLALAPYPLRMVGKLDFASESVDQFTLAIACGVGKQTIDLDTVQGFFVQGKKYIMIEGQGYVEIPLTAILQFNKTINSFDKETLDQDLYLIKTYQAGLITDLIEQGVDLEMSERFRRFWDLVASFRGAGAGGYSVGSACGLAALPKARV